jgi:UDP-glucuronate 4-epimerase
MTTLVTGAAGFIGYHLTKALLERGEDVIGVDDCNAYYDVKLKRARLGHLFQHAAFRFHKLDIADHEALVQVGGNVDIIVHLAAQAGVRYSIEQPFAYSAANLTGHLSVLELARHNKRLRHLVYASSSSVYGAGSALPYTESARADRPQSLYAATKRADEMMSVAYTHQFGIRQTGLRFFTVYGPWGRPDMAYFSFAEAIMAGRPLTMYDNGLLKRDFTYITDIIGGILGVIDHPPDAETPHRLFNIGNCRAELVCDLVELLEEGLGRKAVINNAARPAADPVETRADIAALATLTGFSSETSLSKGIPLFIDWYLWWLMNKG